MIRADLYKGKSSLSNFIVEPGRDAQPRKDDSGGGFVIDHGNIGEGKIYSLRSQLY